MALRKRAIRHDGVFRVHHHPDNRRISRLSIDLSHTNEADLGTTKKS